MARLRASAREARPCALSASAMWAPTRITGLSAAIGSWKTNPIPAPRTCRISSSRNERRSRPSNAIRPAVIRPGGGTSLMIENAVTDLPLPDSPTRPSVSPRPTESSGSDIQALVAILAELGPQRIGDLADGCGGLDGGDDRRDQVVAAAGCGAAGVARRPPPRPL